MKTLKVGDQYRKNELSKTPGGCTVVVEMKGGIFEYDKIKDSEAYIKMASKKPGFIKAYVKE